jgi:uncharacterized membrane protein YgcG
MRSPAAVALAALCVPCACQGATAIVVDVSTDVPCGTADAAHVMTAIAVGPLAGIDERPPVATTSRCDPSTGRIGSLVVVPSGAVDATVAIRVVTAVGRSPDQCAPATASTAAGCIVARRALHFLPHEVVQLPIAMTQACEGVVCAENETCASGKCAPATVQDPVQCASPAGCASSAGPGPADAGADAPAPTAAPPPPAPDAGAPTSATGSGGKGGGDAGGGDMGGGDMEGSGDHRSGGDGAGGSSGHGQPHGGKDP